MDAKFLSDLTKFRRKLAEHFTEHTALPGTNWAEDVPSRGHCAIVSILVHFTMGGELVSTYINGESHWYNRLIGAGTKYDVDLTGDQFGYHPIQVKEAGTLYTSSRVRTLDEANHETMKRVQGLAVKAGISAPINIEATCLMCFTEFVTSLGASHEGEARCPKCRSNAVSEVSDGDC